MSQKLLFILNDQPYGTERSYNALRLARNAVKDDSVELKIFLFGDAAACALPDQKTPDGYYNIHRMLRDAIRRGAEVGVCGACLDARGLQNIVLAEGANRSTLDAVTEWTLWADKVIVF